MEKSEFRVLIQHYFLRGKSIKETEEKLAKYYKESTPPGRPKEVTSQEMIDKIHDIVLNDRRLKVREIRETVNISVGRVLRPASVSGFLDFASYKNSEAIRLRNSGDC